MNHHKLNECSFKLSVPVGEMRGEPDAGNIRYECGQYRGLNYFRRGIFTL